MSDSDSEFSVYSDSTSSISSLAASSKKASTSSAVGKKRATVPPSRSTKQNHKRQKSEVFMIDDSDDSEGEGLFKRLQKRREIPAPAGLKTTGLSDDDSSDDDSSDDDSSDDDSSIDDGYDNRGHEKKDDDVVNKSMIQSISFSSLSDAPPPKKAKKVPWKPRTATSEDCQSFMKELEKNVKKRRFSLSQIPKHQIISTGRTIKSLKAWKGFWPPLREFLQNTVDQLSLMDGKTGRRRSCLTMKASKSGHTSTIVFMCQEQEVCKFIASADELVIEQQYTYPIASRSLDTGVVDTSKTSDSNQAGGFGDGFKTAAVALISNAKGKDFTSLNWFFYALEEKTKISWAFEGLTKESIATFAKCKVLQVVIEKSKMSEHEIAKLSKEEGGNYVMRQVIKVKNIGKAFLEKAVPMFTVFWDLDEGSLVSTQGKNTRGLGGDFIGPVSLQPDIFQGALGSLKPKAGVYVRGIWIRNSKIKDTIMSFYGNRLEVTGRDRNEVDDDELLEAVAYILHRCNDMEHLRMLLTPLRQSVNKTDSSWLLKSPAFFNRVIEQRRDFIRHDVLRIPRGSIFISDKTAKKKNPFFGWASDFLKRNNTPLILIEKGSNKYLFEEIDEYELTGRCVEIIKSNMKGSGKKKGTAHSIFTKFLRFMGVRQAKVVFSKDVGVAFAYDTNIYIPECALSRELIIRVLNVCHSHLEGVMPENYSSLLEALLKTMSGRGYECTAEDATRIVNKANRIQKEAANFLHTTNKTIEVSLDDEDMTPHYDLYEKALNDLINEKRTGKANSGGSIGPGSFGLDDAGDDDCLRPSSAMSSVKVDDKFGGGSILCDASTAARIQNKTFDKKKRDKISILRGVLDKACTIIQKSIPSLNDFLEEVYVGYDGENDSYEAFHDGERIVINVYAFLPKLVKKNPSQTMVHDFVTVVTHELAHALMPNAGHGPGWRACHMNMIMQVMRTLEN